VRAPPLYYTVVPNRYRCNDIEGRGSTILIFTYVLTVALAASGAGLLCLRRHEKGLNVGLFHRLPVGAEDQKGGQEELRRQEETRQGSILILQESEIIFYSCVYCIVPIDLIAHDSNDKTLFGSIEKALRAINGI
jgi:hypothetical protein